MADGSYIYTPSRYGQIYHATTQDEVLGGGAAGGGKTAILLMDPFQQIIVEHQRCQNPEHPYPLKWGQSTGWALHLRRTLTELEQTMVRAERMFPAVDPGATFDRQKTTWTFSSGYRFQFGHCQNSGDWLKYYGLELTHIAFDELVTFLEEQYENICSRLRSSDPVLRNMLKIRAMSNPVVQRVESDNYTVNPVWVRERFVDFNPQGEEVQLFKQTLPDGTVVQKTRLFLPARLKDNPDPAFVQQYTAHLMFQKAHIRSALLDGNWYYTVGSFFGEEWNNQIHVRKPHAIPPEWPQFRMMDWGYKVPGVILWAALDPDDNMIVHREFKFQGMTVKEVSKRIKDIETHMKLWTGKRSKLNGPADTQLWEKRGEEGLSKAEEFMQAGILWVPADKRSRSRNAERIAERLKDHQNGTCTPGLVFFDTCPEIIKTLPAIQTDPGDASTPADGGNDHAFDALAYGVAYASRGRTGMAAVSRSREADLDDEDEEEDARLTTRGRWGYGGA